MCKEFNPFVSLLISIVVFDIECECKSNITLQIMSVNREPTPFLNNICNINFQCPCICSASFFRILWPEPIYLDINFVLKCLSAHCGAKHPPFSSVLHLYAFSRVKSKKWRILLLKIFDKF